MEKETELTAPADTEATPQENRAAKRSKGRQFLQFLIFTGFSISAGVIQFISTGILSTWTRWLPYWLAYLIGLVLSVIWNFTFNRKFTFKASNNIPLAMGLVVIYYCAFTPLSTFGADAIVNAWQKAAGENWHNDYELVITASMMILNFLTEFLWDKFVVFNAKVTDSILKCFKKKSAQAEQILLQEETAATDAEQAKTKDDKKHEK